MTLFCQENHCDCQQIICNNNQALSSSTSDVVGERLSLMVWSVAFYLVENCSSEIQDGHFALTLLEVIVQT